MASKLKKKWDSLDANIQKVAKTLGAIASVIGILIAFSGWSLGQMDSILASRIDEQTKTMQEQIDFLLEKTAAHEADSALTFKRLEILTLIDTDPSNTVEIKKLYKEYRDAGGNHYVASVIVHWCQKYYPQCDI